MGLRHPNPRQGLPESFGGRHFAALPTSQEHRPQLVKEEATQQREFALGYYKEIRWAQQKDGLAGHWALSAEQQRVKEIADGRLT